MPRLIDADKVLASWDVTWMWEYDESGCGVRKKAVAVSAIEAAPAIDAEPVVRCKECIFCRGDGILADGLTFCKAWGQITSTEGYCFRGVKMDGGTDNA